MTSYTKRCQQCVVPSIHHSPCILTPHTAGDQIYGAQSRPSKATMTGVIATPHQVFDLQNTSKTMLVNWSRTVSSGASGHQSMMLHVNHWFITVLCWTLQNVRALPFQIQCQRTSEIRSGTNTGRNHQRHQITMLDASYQAATARCQVLHPQVIILDKKSTISVSPEHDAGRHSSDCHSTMPGTPPTGRQKCTNQ